MRYFCTARGWTEQDFFLREISVLFGKMRPCGVVGSERKNFRSKHREKIPFPVFSPSCAAARRLKMLVGKYPKPSMKTEKSVGMALKRTVQIKFCVTEEERAFILEKMKLVPTTNMAAYLRKPVILDI